MNPRTEGHLLRLALARGLLTWEDLNEVCERPALAPGAPADSARWVPRLVAAGRLDPEAVERLAAEIESAGTDLTQDLLAVPAPAADFWPSWRELRFPEDPGAPGAGAGAGAGTGAGTNPPRTFPTPGLALPLEPELRSLAGWPRYRLERFLGSGGMGVVYRALDPTLGRPVALKFLHRNEPGQAERFLQEARAQARVDHPGVCRVYEVGEVEGRPYIAMQLIEGGSLTEAAAGLPLERQVELVRDTARAIHAAHRTGLIHRDLKPANVLVETDDGGALHPYVVDFGLARDQEDSALSKSGMISGTPAYLSPEQAQGLPLDRRSDVYSLGVVLYELLAGRPPFVGANPAAILVRVVQEEARPLRRRAPAVPPDLETIAMKCLEKDPARRYDSARAVAEDLERYLEGEPILARPSGWLYRAGKRVRKNRALAVVAAAAVLAVTLAAGTALRVRWQAGERAELAQRFGQRVKDLEYRMRLEALQPLHDTSAFRGEIRRELAGIRAEMDRLGPLAEGPGHYALGRAYLALHQSERAREHLERAWAAGERTPQAAATLGRAVGLSYQKALADADRFRSAAPGGGTREEIETAYRRPALAYLKDGLARGDERLPYLAALIAYYQGRYGAALRDAREAYRQESWFYEARVLAAEVHAARADDAAEAGRYGEAFGLYDRAGAVYAGLIAAVPSDAALYAADCGWQGRRIEVAMAAGMPWEGQVPAALRQCDLALAADHELGEALAGKARILWRRAEQRSRHGVDPLPDLAAAVELAGRAIRLDPKDALAHRNLAIALRLVAERALARGIDAGPAVERAMAAARRLVEVQPELAASHNTLGLAYLALARQLRLRGADPAAAVEQAAASCRRAIAINPRYGAAYANLGTVWKIQAEHQVGRGIDPAAPVARAAGALERAVRLNPRSAAAHNNLGNAHLTLAEFQLASGADARPALERAAASYLAALRLKSPYGPFNLAYTRRCLALAALARGEDPGPHLAAAGRWLDQAARLNAADFEVFVERGRAGEVAARWAVRTGRDPGPALAAAAAAFARAEALNAGDPEVFLGPARIERLRAERAIAAGVAGASRKAEAAAAVARGLERAGRALAINPGEARGLAEKGGLLALGARLEPDPRRRAARADEARRALAEAIRRNPVLRREVEPLLAGLSEPAPAPR